MRTRAAVRRAAVVALWVAVALPPLASGAVGGNSTITTSTSASSQSGTINAQYFSTTATLGPADIAIGSLTGCVLAGTPPFADCSLDSGSGTLADPFWYSCSSPLALSGCSGGQAFHVNEGTLNFNTHVQTVIAVAATPTQPVPLGPWVPLASAGGVLSAVLLLRRRRSL